MEYDCLAEGSSLCDVMSKVKWHPAYKIFLTLRPEKAAVPGTRNPQDVGKKRRVTTGRPACLPSKRTDEREQEEHARRSAC